ncbi:uncharacterized protein N7506_004884 [Penicillium brevicompactum]|uniref:uncharacterized protein n=1 Tax=Penicillium brevicompactum TaxID=5074 RepID=UPI00254244F8|nr:uncharacterized protein N7506_004884 [Penicillium brevicompactum]KAJ5336862.1 hypothetical protein N7506_004884 [Penicillium brevicompactum]
MASPYKPYSSPRAAPLKKGLFTNGIWCCNCPDRPPAVRRQTKKEGPNIGKWFWTCAQPMHLRCSFFLWEADATIREQAAVLANSRSELDPLTLTPTKSQNPGRSNNGLLTPQTERRFYDTPHPNEFGWNDDLDDDDDLVKTFCSTDTTDTTETFMTQPNYRSESPSKTPRTAQVTSPGKRKLFQTKDDSSPEQRPSFATPVSSISSRTLTFPSSAEVCMTPTPSKYGDVLSADSAFDTSDLAKSLMDILDKHEVVLPNKARDDVTSLLNRHDLKTQGIIRGRDMTRLALKKKDTEIANLKERVANLEAQRQLDRTLLDGFKSLDSTEEFK